MKNQNVKTNILSCSEKLFTRAMKLTGNLDRAKDLVQDTFYKAIKNEALFIDGDDVTPWLFVIMKNEFINYYRKVKRENQLCGYFEQNQLSDFVFVDNNNALNHLNYKDTFNIINGLPGNLKTPFKLFFDGYKYDEIAALTNLPLGTIKSNIHNARKLLKNRVEL